jgi:hypothetical protein
LEPAGEPRIADYRIVCVIRRADGHIRGVCYSADGNAVMYDDKWTLEEAREAIQQGHRLYAVSPSTGVEVEFELDEEGIRLKPRESADLDLDDLPSCS